MAQNYPGKFCIDTLMQARLRDWLIGAFVAIIFYFFAIWLIAFAFLNIIENRYELKVRGQWYPASFLPGYLKIHDPLIDWKDRFFVSSGDIQIQFKVFSLLLGKEKLLISGKNLKVSLREKYSGLAPNNQINIDQVRASIELMPSEEPVVHALEIESPTLKFQLRNK